MHLLQKLCWHAGRSIWTWPHEVTTRASVRPWQFELLAMAVSTSSGTSPVYRSCGGLHAHGVLPWVVRHWLGPRLARWRSQKCFHCGLRLHAHRVFRHRLSVALPSCVQCFKTFAKQNACVCMTFTETQLETQGCSHQHFPFVAMSL